MLLTLFKICKFWSDLLEIVERAVDEDHENECAAEAIDRMDGISGRDDCPNCKCEQRADRRNKVDLASSDSVNEERHGDIDDQAPRFEATIDTELGLRARDTDVVHDLIQIVRNESIAGPL